VPEPPLRILHVARPPIAGVPRYVGELVHDQVGRGWHVVVACPADSEACPLALSAGAGTVVWAAARSPGASTLWESWRLARIIGETRPDALHLHASKAGLAGRLVVRGCRPTIFQPHAWSFEGDGIAARLAKYWERAAAPWADVVLCVSEDERRRAVAAGIRPPRVEVVHNGVDLDRYAPASPSERSRSRLALDLDVDAPLAVCVGRLDVQKNQGVLLDLWPRVRAEMRNAQLALVGDGPHTAEHARRGVPGVRLVGHVDDARRWYAAASVVVQPSRWEGMSLSVLEARACARSVVATDVGGMREAIRPGTGAVVAFGDWEALARALITRFADQHRADAEGAAARRDVERRFDMRATAARVATIYREMLALRR
jgi:glycosyltransferase involved in cell wall biosynthesis